METERVMKGWFRLHNFLCECNNFEMQFCDVALEKPCSRRERAYKVYLKVSSSRIWNSKSEKKMRKCITKLHLGYIIWLHLPLPPDCTPASLPSFTHQLPLPTMQTLTLSPDISVQKLLTRSFADDDANKTRTRALLENFFAVLLRRVDFRAEMKTSTKIFTNSNSWTSSRLTNFGHGILLCKKCAETSLIFKLQPNAEAIRTNFWQKTAARTATIEGKIQNDDFLCRNRTGWRQSFGCRQSPIWNSCPIGM